MIKSLTSLEERFNSLSHGITAVMAIAGLVILMFLESKVTKTGVYLVDWYMAVVCCCCIFFQPFTTGFEIKK